MGKRAWAGSMANERDANARYVSAMQAEVGRTATPAGRHDAGGFLERMRHWAVVMAGWNGALARLALAYGRL